MALSIIEEALRRRLVHDGCGTGEDRRLMVIMKQMTKFCLHDGKNDGKPDDTPEDALKLFNNLQKDINMALVTNEKYSKIDQMYQRTFADLEADILSKEQQLEKVKKELSNLVLELEYVEKLKKVSGFPDRLTTEKTMLDYDKKKQNLLRKMERQRINIQLLGEACVNLQKVLETDDVEMDCPMEPVQ